MTFGFYGLLRKRSALGPVTGLMMETLLVSPFAVGWLVLCAVRGSGVLGQGDLRTTLLVLSTGVVTSIPLLLFAEGARRLRLTTLGLLQYVGPTCQFLLGYFVFGEPFGRDRAWAFSLIWLGLALYSVDAWWARRRVP